MADSVAAFLVVAAVVIVTPGPDTALTIRNTLLGGRRGGVFTAIGVSAGQATWSVATSAGIVALLVASEPVFRAVKLIGAAYLIWIGFRTFQAARRDVWREASGATTAPPVGMRRAFREGVLVEALNPKTAAFFLAFVPQFVDPSRGSVAMQFVVLGFVSVALNTLVDIAVAFAAGGVKNGAASRPALVRRLREASGAAMIALGIGLTLAKRPAS